MYKKISFKENVEITHIYTQFLNVSRFLFRYFLFKQGLIHIVTDNANVMFMT